MRNDDLHLLKSPANTKRLMAALNQSLANTQHEMRRSLAKIMIKLFDLWGIKEAGDRLELLGLDADNPGILDQFWTGESELPDTGDTMERTSWLLTIHKSLGLLYPYNEDIRYSWGNRRNKAFENLTPLAVMKDQGLVGIMRVTNYLEWYLLCLLSANFQRPDRRSTSQAHTITTQGSQ